MNLIDQKASVFRLFGYIDKECERKYFSRIRLCVWSGIQQPVGSLIGNYATGMPSTAGAQKLIHHAIYTKVK